jgi:hypothetical protein
MSIASKISLPSPSWWKLNAIYLFNLTLILLFLILTAITGPATKLWWMTITYSTPGAKGEAGGSSWKMGGWGVCKSGEECTGAGSRIAPAISEQIKSVLMYHFAGMSSPFSLMLSVRREKRANEQWLQWYSSLRWHNSSLSPDKRHQHGKDGRLSSYLSSPPSLSSQ